MNKNRHLLILPSIQDFGIFIGTKTNSWSRYIETMCFQNVFHSFDAIAPEHYFASRKHTLLERTYKPHYHYQNFSPLANGTDLNREKYRPIGIKIGP